MGSEHGRWADPAMMVLTSLADGPKHGYAITQDLNETTGRAIGPGTLYAVISRLEDRGLIEPLPPEQRRRPYRITAAGAQTLQSEATEMRQLADLGLRRLSARPRLA